MSSGIVTEHQLVLRVMRLARPQFNTPVSFPVDHADPYAPGIADAVKEITGEDSVDFPLGSYLMAPQTMALIYLGETFTFYVAILNDGASDCTDVCVQVDIQTQSQRVTLPCQMQEANATLRPKQQAGQILTHEVKEIGQHILVCAVTYKSNAGEKMFFRKFFKFPVNKPIDVRTKFYNVEDNMNSDVYLEAQIQNLCINSLVLERVVLEPSVEHYRCTEIKSPSTDEKDVIIQPQEVYQYLFCLSPVTKEDATGVNNFRGASAISVIGKLDMYWRTSMGERGRLQTSPLQRMAPGYGDLRLTVENIPKRVKLQQLFTVTCRLYNCCERSLDLTLTLDGSLQPALIFCSVSGVHLGQILPNNSIEFTLQILPTAKGLYAISGLRLTDSLLRRTYEHDEIAQVIVVKNL